MKRENKRYINFVRKEIQNELDIFQSFFQLQFLKKKSCIKTGIKFIFAFETMKNF